MKRLGLFLLLAGAAWGQTIGVKPTALAFGSVSVGGSAFMTVTVTSNVVGPNSVMVNSTDPAFSASPTSFVLPDVGAMQTVTITFSPTVATAYNAQVVFTPAQPPGQAVVVSGTGVAPVNFSVSPTSLDFGNVPVGTSSSRMVTVTDLSNFPLNLVVTGSSGFSISPANFTLGGMGASTPVAITFTPTSASSFGGQISFAATSPFNTTATITVTASASGAATPVVTLKPAGLIFTTLAGCTAVQQFTISASAPVNLTLDSTNPAFSVDLPTITGQTLANVNVSFNASAPGSIVGAAINVTASQGGVVVQRAVLILSATVFDLTTSPTLLTFGNTRVGGSSTQTVQLGTTSPVGATIPVTAASDSAAFTAAQAAIPPGTSQVTFTPPSPGAFKGNVSFTIADPGSPSCTSTKIVGVSGTGFAVDVNISPTSLDFGKVAVGTTSPPLAAAITNNSTIDFNGATAGSNSNFGVDVSTFKIAAGKTQPLNFTFKPNASGAQTGAFTFTLTSVTTAAAGVAPVQVTLTLNITGEGVTCGLTLSDASINFGDVEVGNTAQRRVTLTNPGAATCDVTASVPAPFAVSIGSFSMSPGAVLALDIRFTPTTTTSFQARLNFAATGLTRTVDLSGRGIVTPPPTLSFLVAPDNTTVSAGGTVSLGTTGIGSSNSKQIQINNTGTVAASITDIHLGSASSAEGDGSEIFQRVLGPFTIEGLPALPVTVAPGASATFSVTFRPDTPGAASTVLTITGRSLDAALNLRGVGLVSSATIPVSGTIGPAQQPSAGLRIAQATSVPLRGRLTINFSTDTPGAPDDPAIQFAAGGRTMDFTIPAGSADAQFGGAPQAAFQTGTVAGNIRLSAVIADDAGTDVTPLNVPIATVTIPRSAPVIRSATIANRTTTGFQLVIVGFATGRQMGNLNGQLTAAPGVNLTVTGLPLDLASTFTAWWTSAAAAPFGSLFTLTVPFTPNGDLNNIKTGSFTLTNPDGASSPVQVTISP